MGIANAAEADGHAFVARGGLGAIGPEKAVPPGEVKSEIAVVFLNHHGVVYAVHLRRNHEQPQHPIEAARQADIAPTVLTLLSLDIPQDMTAHVLVLK